MPPHEQEQKRRQHIFAVNDAKEFLEVLRELFQEERYNVTATNFAPDTFGQIEALQPDVLIVDLAVGKRVGWDLLERLATGAQTKGIPVIVVSTSPKILEEAQENPDRFDGNWFISKPLDLNDLLHAVHALIGRA